MGAQWLDVGDIVTIAKDIKPAEKRDELGIYSGDMCTVIGERGGYAVVYDVLHHDTGSTLSACLGNLNYIARGKVDKKDKSFGKIHW